MRNHDAMIGPPPPAAIVRRCKCIRKCVRRCKCRRARCRWPCGRTCPEAAARRRPSADGACPPTPARTAQLARRTAAASTMATARRQFCTSRSPMGWNLPCVLTVGSSGTQHEPQSTNRGRNKWAKCSELERERERHSCVACHVSTGCAAQHDT